MPLDHTPIPAIAIVAAEMLAERATKIDLEKCSFDIIGIHDAETLVEQWEGESLDDVVAIIAQDTDASLTHIVAHGPDGEMFDVTADVAALAWNEILGSDDDDFIVDLIRDENIAPAIANHIDVAGWASWQEPYLAEAHAEAISWLKHCEGFRAEVRS